MSSLQPSLSADLEFKGKLVFRIIKPETSRIAEIDAKKTVISTRCSIKMSHDFGFKGQKTG
jgi:hypothetical protein